MLGEIFHDITCTRRGETVWKSWVSHRGKKYRTIVFISVADDSINRQKHQQCTIFLIENVEKYFRDTERNLGD